jgi:hypothetical protein
VKTNIASYNSKRVYDWSWDMESNPNSPWDFSSVSDPGGDMTRATGAKHGGSYGLQLVLNDTNAHTATISGLSYSSTIYVNFWMYGDSSLSGGTYMYPLEIGLASDWIAGIILGSNHTTYTDIQFARNKPSYNQIGSTYQFTLGTWHEMRVVITGMGGTSGVFQLWMDGSKICEETGVDLSAGYKVTNVQWGRVAGSGTPAGALYFDDGWVDADGP